MGLRDGTPDGNGGANDVVGVGANDRSEALGMSVPPVPIDGIAVRAPRVRRRALSHPTPAVDRGVEGALFVAHPTPDSVDLIVIPAVPAHAGVARSSVHRG